MNVSAGLILLRDVEDAQVFGSDMSHAKLGPFKELYTGTSSPMDPKEERRIFIAGKFNQLIYGFNADSNKFGINGISDMSRFVILWADAHFHGYVQEIERFLEWQTDSLIPVSEFTQDEKRAFDVRKAATDDKYVTFEEDDVHLYNIVKTNIAVIQRRREELYRLCNKQKRGV
eukprot:GHVU01102572.1.p1 GENE.GHVU01102572.1~~GHVU01102572.1.p1  ORF type:complete len:173 (-),score=22.39 GHVU01102572.1:202-720(-)